MKRKCEFCEKTTNKPLDEFYLINWNAYSIDREKSRCACPEHRELLKEQYRLRLK